MITFSKRPDSVLVDEARRGSRDAFGEIVRRYQNLVCALAFSRAGSVTASEDLAQETFVAAWKNLHELREPAQLKAWLAGIVQRLGASHVRTLIRRRALQPVESLEAMYEAGDDDESRVVPEPASAEQDPAQRVADDQESALVWQALAALPEKYREPLVLFYREEESLTAVASALGIAEDAARQRLYRGRQLLRREMTGMIESTLRRTAPTMAFTAAVMAALPAVSPTPAMASTVALAAGAAKGAVESKGLWATLSGWPLAGPLFGLLAGLGSARLAARAYPEGQPRRLVQRHASGIVFGIWMASLLLAAVLATGIDRMSASGVIAMVSVWTALLLAGIFLTVRHMENALAKLDDRGAITQPAPNLARWRSSLAFLGLPLVDIAVSTKGSGRALGWVAIGDVAVSPFLAIGGIGMAPIALGGITVGIFSLSLFGVALGAVAFGSIAAGVWAYGITAIGWQSAVGTAAVAVDYALGGLAQANEANTAAASAFISELWFQPVIVAFTVATPFLVVLAAVLAMFGWWRVRRAVVSTDCGAQ